jgi:hypothetical protein
MVREEVCVRAGTALLPGAVAPRSAAKSDAVIEVFQNAQVVFAGEELW